MKKNRGALKARAPFVTYSKIELLQLHPLRQPLLTIQKVDIHQEEEEAQAHPKN